MESRSTAPVGCQDPYARRVYDVDTRPQAAGRLLSVSINPTSLAERDLIGRICWEAFEHHTQPCDGCPVFAPGAGEVGLLSEAGEAYRVVHVRRHQVKCEVDVVPLEHSLVAALMQEKLRRLAKQAKLSDQQNRVLDLLAHGKTAKEIAAEIGLTERTAKFHVTNLLRKLGAESRMDVLRLLLAPNSELAPAERPLRSSS
jgi:DNA-binding CsgD family transcriptional regulator